MPATSEWIFRNVSRRPVEVHLSEGVVVLPPQGTLATSEPEAGCLALERKGVLTRHAVPPPAEAAPAEAKKPTTRRSSRDKPSAAKKSTRTRKAKSPGKDAKPNRSEVEHTDDVGSEKPAESGEGDAA